MHPVAILIPEHGAARLIAPNAPGCGHAPSGTDAVWGCTVAMDQPGRAALVILARSFAPWADDAPAALAHATGGDVVERAQALAAHGAGGQWAVFESGGVCEPGRTG